MCIHKYLNVIMRERRKVLHETQSYKPDSTLARENRSKIESSEIGRQQSSYEIDRDKWSISISVWGIHSMSRMSRTKILSSMLTFWTQKMNALWFCQNFQYWSVQTYLYDIIPPEFWILSMHIYCIYIHI